MALSEILPKSINPSSDNSDYEAELSAIDRKLASNRRKQKLAKVGVASVIEIAAIGVASTGQLGLAALIAGGGLAYLGI